MFFLEVYFIGVPMFLFANTVSLLDNECWISGLQ